jgi:hypothetical protein
MVATGMRCRSLLESISASSRPTSGSHRGHAVDFFDGRCFRIIHHLAMAATGRKELELLADAEAGEEGIEDVIGADFSGDLTEVIQCMA